jgi:predicted DNA-binding transcriptional regulator AlpA
MTDDLDEARQARKGSPFLTTKQAAYYLGFTARSLHAMRRKGRGPRFVRLGRAVRYHIRDLVAYANEAGVERSDG